MREEWFPRKKLEQVLRYACTNKHSDFYKKRIPEEIFRREFSKKQWQRVPFVTKEDMLATPFWERVFTPRGVMQMIRNTYGSSGKKILIMPRTCFGDFSDPYRTMNMTRVMTFFASAFNDFPRIAVGGQMFFGDVTQLAVTAKIAASAGINSLFILPYSAISFAEYLRREGVIENIRAVQLTGERCSPLQFRKIQALYPRATVFANYSSSEARECVAIACEHSRAAGQGTILGTVPEYYAEIINPKTGETIEEAGVHGELVLTTTEINIPFPMIRYRTGDVSVYVPRTCVCEGRVRGFEVLGRESVLPIRMTRGEITVDNVQDVLLNTEGVYSDYFEIHYTEEDLGESALPRVTLKVFPLAEGLSADEIARDVESRLKVFHGYTYALGVEEGFYLPLSISFLENVPQGRPGKPRAPIAVRHVVGSREKSHSVLLKHE